MCRHHNVIALFKTINGSLLKVIKFEIELKRRELDELIEILDADAVRHDPVFLGFVG